MALELTDANFEEKVTKNPGVSVVDFWAVWCGPCNLIAPHIEKLHEKFKDNDKVVVGKVDVDNQPDTSQRFGIRNIPTVLIFQNGEVVKKMVGAQRYKDYEDAVEGLLAKV